MRETNACDFLCIAFAVCSCCHTRHAKLKIFWIRELFSRIIFPRRGKKQFGDEGEGWENRWLPARAKDHDGGLSTFLCLWQIRQIMRLVLMKLGWLWMSTCKYIVSSKLECLHLWDVFEAEALRMAKWLENQLFICLVCALNPGAIAIMSRV